VSFEAPGEVTSRLVAAASALAAATARRAEDAPARPTPPSRTDPA
jgi:hypothetical protein